MRWHEGHAVKSQYFGREESGERQTGNLLREYSSTLGLFLCL